jgi:monoamine oxidase
MKSLKIQKLPVVIIGAGAAGLAAAKKLKAKNIRFRILEARPRIGGRIFTVTEPSLNYPVEMGAEFFHGKRSLPLALAKKLKLNPRLLPGLLYRVTKDAVTEDSGRWKRMEKIMHQLRLPAGPDLSIEAAIEKIRPIPEDLEALDAVKKFIQGFNAADLAKYSTRAFWHEEMEGGHDQTVSYRVAGGYGPILNYFGNHLAYEELSLGTEVTRVVWKKGHVEIYSHGKDHHPLPTIYAKKCLITLPVSLLKTEAVTFSPSLHEKKEALSLIEMGHAARLVFRFRSPFWLDKKKWGKKMKCRFPAEGFFQTEHPIFRTWWTTSPIQSPLLTAWVGGPPALRFMRQSLTRVKTEATQAAGDLFGWSEKQLREQLVEIYYHPWSSDKFSQGAYSYTAVNGDSARRELAKPLADTLFFAGEATDYDEPGTVSAALRSGERAAREMI